MLGFIEMATVLFPLTLKLSRKFKD